MFDTGASITISPFKEDFISFEENDNSTSLMGVSGRTCVEGSGVIQLTVKDDSGIPVTFTTKALLVPNATIRLLSVQSF